jgi:hypothetical protein
MIKRMPSVMQGTELVALPTVSTQKLDLLFVLGNSASTLEHQIALANPFPSLLAQISAQGRPDLHIGGITPDLGTSTMSGALGPMIAGSVGGCSGHGDGGALKRYNAAATADRFLIDSANATNHPSMLAVDIRDVMYAGSTGCGFQQDLAAIRASFTNALNIGFPRDDAALSIVMLADKDECSALDPNLFASDTSAFGELSSFRCVNFGYACSEPDMTTPGPRTNCVPNPHSKVIEDPAAFVAVIRAQAAHPRRVAVGAIIAPMRGARRAMGDPCIEVDVDLAHCTAVEEVDGVETPLAACTSPTQTDCYELATDPAICPNAAHRELVVHRSSAPPPGYDLLRCK